MHLLITLSNRCKITTTDIVDKYISAEIPDKETNLSLHEIVMKNMIHGPCGDWCMVENKCSKKFPKQFIEQTIMDETGYPQYRRRNTHITYERPGGYTVNNSWVVPYCPDLLLQFNCHINVEVVSSIKAVKYLYKYIYKGHDAATVIIGEAQNNPTIDHDEIRDYIETRYVGPVEACYRILSKTLQDKSHAIIRLPVHIPGEQSVIIPNQTDVATVINNSYEFSSMLLDYFKLNANNPDARQYSYVEIPSYYTYTKANKKQGTPSSWGVRKGHFNTIGRMFSVSPTQLELFHLRLLLLHVKGAKSFDELKTVRNIVYPSFTAACLAAELIEDDEEWNRAMEEAALWMMPKRLRLLFVRILIHCQPIHPEEIWEKFKDAMSEDFARRHSKEESRNKAYFEINNILNREGHSLAEFPTMNQTVVEMLVDDSLEVIQEASEIGFRQYNNLNNEQKEVVDQILNVSCEDNYEGSTCFYIDGQGGSGKTFIYTTIYNLLSAQNIKVCSMAFTS